MKGIEAINFCSGEWFKTSFNTLNELFDNQTKVYKRPFKIHKTNQEDFENRLYFYAFDSMGHMNFYRMDEDKFNEEFHTDEFYKKNTAGFIYKWNGVDHIVCGKCDRCKTCGNCKCDDKH